MTNVLTKQGDKAPIARAWHGAPTTVNLTPPDLEDGAVRKGPWSLEPPPARGSNFDGSVNLSALAANEEDGMWMKYPHVPVLP
jgi:hypothetical protein